MAGYFLPYTLSKRALIRSGFGIPRPGVGVETSNLLTCSRSPAKCCPTLDPVVRLGGDRGGDMAVDSSWRPDSSREKGIKASALDWSIRTDAIHPTNFSDFPAEPDDEYITVVKLTSLVWVISRTELLDTVGQRLYAQTFSVMKPCQPWRCTTC
ncbi:hypothetical protein ACVBEG_27100 [Pseudomonas sp. GG8]